MYVIVMASLLDGNEMWTETAMGCCTKEETSANPHLHNWFGLLQVL